MDFDAIIVGSGFGGTVAATTLVNAGKKVLGYKATVNLCAEMADGDVQLIEMTGLADLLITYQIPITDGTPPRPLQVIELLPLLADPKTGRIYLHYEAGKARTGVMAAIYRMAAI